jgi:predicted nucleic acid-binding protein
VRSFADSDVLVYTDDRDALIVRAASAAGCARILSEDMQTGRRFDGIEIVNPFAT